MFIPAEMYVLIRSVTFNEKYRNTTSSTVLILPGLNGSNILTQPIVVQLTSLLLFNDESVQRCCLMK